MQLQGIPTAAENLNAANAINSAVQIAARNALSKTAATPGNEKSLREAAEEGDTTKVVILLKEGANLTCCDQYKRLPLHRAALNNRV